MTDRFVVSLDDRALRTRLRQTRWLDMPAGPAGAYGVDQAALRALVEYWLDAFSWDRMQAAINRHDHYRTTIDGQCIHYIHVRSGNPRATPLILTHGWPWTFWDMRRLFAPLTDPSSHGGRESDAFDLIVPSLPGFGFSTPAAPAGGNFWRTADLWHRLMTDVLGYDRYGAAGGDWGAFVSAQLGHKYAWQIIAIHLSQAVPLGMFSTGHPWRARISGGPSPSEAALRYERRFASHLAVHMIEPDTLAYGLNDSPMGMLAWLFQRWCSWDGTSGEGVSALTKNQMLANATLYWLNESLPSSLRFYANAGLEPWRPSHGRHPLVEAPTGVTMLAGDLPEGVDLERVVARFRHSPRGAQYNIVHAAAHEKGGHFAHFQNPAAIVADIRATFRAVRGAD
ncbi:epoxide hydrolase family protein [Sphingobium aquiterrae]|uniref:epoxide hydrolase family protein n=1 Tax=Sphingobium aquiterrae TaxID=2038656 RepID=UPI0030167D1C